MELLGKGKGSKRERSGGNQIFSLVTCCLDETLVVLVFKRFLALE